MQRPGTCGRLAPLLWDYADGALDADRREAVRQHLVTCRRCAREAAETERAARRLRLYAESERGRADPGAWEDLRERLAGAPRETCRLSPPAPWWRHRAVIRPALCCAAVSMLTMLMALRLTPAPSCPSAPTGAAASASFLTEGPGLSSASLLGVACIAPSATADGPTPSPPSPRQDAPGRHGQVTPPRRAVDRGMILAWGIGPGRLEDIDGAEA